MTNEVNEMSAASRGSGANYSAKPDGWIPVAERLPEMDDRVMVCHATDEWVTIGHRHLTGAYLHWDGDDHEELYEPTHWMPLPAPPH